MSERGARSREPGWLGTAGGALLLVVVGFVVGLIAGTAFEEPDLVIDQLAGRGERVPVEEVDLSRTGGIPAVSPEQAEATAPGLTDFRADPGPVDSGPPPRTAAAPPPEPARSPEPAPRRGPGYAVQVGAFGEQAVARRLASQLRDGGLPGYVVEGRSAPWRVRVGPYPSEAEARRVAGRLRSERELPTWVLRIEGS